MTPDIAPHESERFRAAILRRLGLQFDDAKLGFLGEVLRRRLQKLRQSSDAYLGRLEHDAPNDEVGPLAQELTVGETYFFRNNDQFRAFAEVVLPDRIHVQRTPKVLRVLSAGCASGEEAYTLAILARETMTDPSWDVCIRAVDINPAVLEKALRARYSSWALRETPPDIQRRWFRPDGRDMILDERVRTAVTFEARNLVTDDLDLWQPAAYDVIFCRNVMMYFSPEQMRATVASIARALAPGGFLFLGHAETLRGFSDEFHLLHTHETFYYKRKGGQKAGASPLAHVLSPSNSVSALAPSFADAWVDTIREASERVAALIPAMAAADPPRRISAPAWNMATALDLLRKERFTEALTYVRQLPPESGDDPGILLLEAMLLSHGGELAAAAEVCRRLLQIDEMNAGAHYVLALCCENVGDRAAAAEHDRVAVYSDPGFAMPRLHLGLLARRAGDRIAARRELTQALILLKREDASRLLLFGGGFNREALLALCESALRDCGGKP
jgi:chemotaxis protein methyltransferase CheR